MNILHILIVHPQVLVRNELTAKLEEVLNDDNLSIDVAATQLEALKRIRQHQHDPYAALITSLDLPRDRNSILDEENRGLRLVEALGSAKTKCLIMVPETQRPLKLQTRGLNCLFLNDDTDMFEKMVSATKDALAGRRRQPRLSVRFVQDVNSPNWNYWMDGGLELPMFNGRSGMFELPLRQMSVLAKRSAKLGSMQDKWLKEMVQIGKELGRLIFESDKGFHNLFEVAVDSAGGIEKMRFSFDVRQNMFSLAVEALVGPETEVHGWVSRAGGNSGGSKVNRKITQNKRNRVNKNNSRISVDHSEPIDRVPFWMLRTPIYRTLSVSPSGGTRQSRRPLFEEEGTFNCLVIEADVAGKVIVPGKGEIDLPELGNIDIECAWLEANLKDRKNQDEWGIANVVRINAASVPNNKSFSKHLEDTLAERKWHLVHYSGHSMYVPAIEGPAGRGFLFLPGSERPIEALDAGLFANWLTDTQFLFLSSCHSSEEGFVFEMARNYVPAVLGFRWDIRDDLAADFATKFYQNLFGFRSIESAFVAARGNVRSAHGAQEQIWAAPMLVMLESRRANAAA